MEKPEMWHEKKDVDEQGTERARQAEKMVKFLSFAKNIPTFKGKSVEEVFSNEENKREFINDLSSSDFTELIKSINAFLRDKEINSPEMEWKTMKVDGMCAIGPEYFSQHKDKQELFSMLVKAMQEMNRRGRELGDIALLCGAGINAIHGFMDGNGRTSRFVYLMLNNNFGNELKNNLKKVLTEDGRGVINVDPSWLGYYINKLIEKETGFLDKETNKTNFFGIWCDNEDILAEKISEASSEKFTNLINNNKDFLYAVIDCFANNKDISKYADHDEKRYLSADLLFDDLTIGEMNQIVDRYWELKKRRVEILIDCIVNPDKEEYQIEDEGLKMSMKYYLEKSIASEAEDSEHGRSKEEKEGEA